MVDQLPPCSLRRRFCREDDRSRGRSDSIRRSRRTDGRGDIRRCACSTIRVECAVALDSPRLRDARDIPRARCCALTCKANPMTGSLSTRAKRKLREMLGLLANATGSG